MIYFFPPSPILLSYSLPCDLERVPLSQEFREMKVCSPQPGSIYPKGFMYVVNCSAGSWAPGSQICSETQRRCMENTLKARSAIHHLKL